MIAQLEDDKASKRRSSYKIPAYHRRLKLLELVHHNMPNKAHVPRHIS